MSRGESVLIVEDDQSLAEILSLALRTAGFEAYAASGGVEGYTRYYQHPTDWVVTDIQMPGLDGISMMHCIRAINPQVRTVYMSAAVEEYRGRLDRERKDFAARVLRKPFSRTDLIEQLDEPRDITASATIQTHHH
jgi:CheY-like chemotaxis protein